MVSRPMLAAPRPNEQESLKFPLLATPKVDGVRALKVNGSLLSRSFKPIRNKAIRNLMERILPDGADGELSIDHDFQKTVSAVMSEHAELPDSLKYYFFDWVQDSDLDMPYFVRVRAIYDYVHHSDVRKLNLIIPLMPVLINNMTQLNAYETSVLEQGYEGVVLRDPNGRYKCGRATFKEGLMIKIKRHDDCEAIIVGTQELMHNLNEERRDNFGKTVRSSAKEHKIGSGILGAIVAITKENNTFKIGTGYTNEQRASLWVARDELVGKLVKYRYSSLTPDRIPRCPVFLGLRPTEDLT